MSHPSIVCCHGIFEDVEHGVLGVAMDDVEGVALRDVDRARLTVGQKAALLRHVARALAHIHELGLVHRDVKPANVLVTRSFWNRPDDPANTKLVDFGIVALDAGERLTKTGQALLH